MSLNNPIGRMTDQLSLYEEKEMEEEKTGIPVVAKICQKSFDYEEWRRDMLQTAMDGMRLLQEERAELQKKAQEISERIAKIDHDLDMMKMWIEDRDVTHCFRRDVASNEQTQEQPTENGDAASRARDVNVKKRLKEIAYQFNEWTDFDVIMDTMRKEHNSDVLESSVLSALRRLVKEGVMAQEPADDGMRLRKEERKWKAMFIDDPWNDSDKRFKVCEGVSRLLEHNPNGISGKDLAWLATEVGVDASLIEDVIKEMKHLETVEEGGQHVLREKAPPNSVMELKRMKITDRPLFPGMDRPEHA